MYNVLMMNEELLLFDSCYFLASYYWKAPNYCSNVTSTMIYCIVLPYVHFYGFSFGTVVFYFMDELRRGQNYLKLCKLLDNAKL